MKKSSAPEINADIYDEFDNFYKYANFPSAEEIIKLLERTGFEIQEKSRQYMLLRT